MITKETLVAKRQELQNAYDKALAEMNAFGGALQFCDHLLQEIEKGAGASPAPQEDSLTLGDLKTALGAESLEVMDENQDA